MAMSSSRRRSDGADATVEQENAPVHDDALDLSALQAALYPALEELPRAPRQARSREKRAELLKSAEALFVERGYAATTADDIALTAGVSVGTFYNYFRNKRQILLALTLLRLSDIFTHVRLAQMDLAHGDHHATIHDAITAVLAGDRRPGLRVVWQQLMSLEPELAPYQATVRRYALNLIEERLRAARESGGVWPDLDIEGTALALFSLLDSLGSRRDDDLPIERMIDSVTALIERAIFPPTCAPCGAGATPVSATTACDGDVEGGDA
jgi:TetR/AcrR family transcriptional repressor of mexJK operon